MEHFHLAPVENNDKMEQLLAKYENEIAKEIGGDVVLVAYQRNSKEDSWH